MFKFMLDPRFVHGIRTSTVRAWLRDHRRASPLRNALRALLRERREKRTRRETNRRWRAEAHEWRMIERCRVAGHFDQD